MKSLIFFFSDYRYYLSIITFYANYLTENKYFKLKHPTLCLEYPLAARTSQFRKRPSSPPGTLQRPLTSLGFYPGLPTVPVPQESQTLRRKWHPQIPSLFCSVMSSTLFKKMNALHGVQLKQMVSAYHHGMTFELLWDRLNPATGLKEMSPGLPEM